MGHGPMHGVHPGVWVQAEHASFECVGMYGQYAQYAQGRARGSGR